MSLSSKSAQKMARIHMTLHSRKSRITTLCAQILLYCIILRSLTVFAHCRQLSYLPPAVTYSQIDVNLTADGKNTGQIVSLLRRDLFDARFQLANEEDDSDDEGSAYANMIPRSSDLARGLGVGYFQNSDSDLIKGVYEGGLKTWEASLDLIVSISSGIALVSDMSPSRTVCASKGTVQTAKAYAASASLRSAAAQLCQPYIYSRPCFTSSWPRKRVAQRHRLR